MNTLFRSWFAALAATSIAAGAAPREVETFDVSTWQSLQQVQRPTAVVFTTTDCAHCPAVIAALADEARRRADASVVAVVMDGEAANVADAHYRPADRLFAFEGQAARLRHSVDPGWRGMTPYVALLSPGRPPVWVLGRPSPAQIETWASAAGPDAGPIIPSHRENKR